MKPVDDHIADVLAACTPLNPLDLQLLDAHGCLLAEDVLAPLDLPSFDNSSMDGYAVRVADTADASEEYPAVLPVVGDIAAGRTQLNTISPGMCARIMTGAPVPAGADAVVPVEWTDAGVATVWVSTAPGDGQCI